MKLVKFLGICALVFTGILFFIPFKQGWDYGKYVGRR